MVFFTTAEGVSVVSESEVLVMFVIVDDDYPANKYFRKA